MYASLWVHMCVPMNLCMYMCTYISLCVCVYECVCVCIRTHVHTLADLHLVHCSLAAVGNDATFLSHILPVIYYFV